MKLADSVAVRSNETDAGKTLPSAGLIAQVVAPGLVGGVETVVAELLSAGKAHSRDQACFALLQAGDELPVALAPLHKNGIRIARVESAHREYLAQYRTLKSLLSANNVRLVHSHGYHADVLCSFAARSLGIPHVATLHGFVGATRRGRFYEWLQLKALGRAAGVIAVSESVATRARIGGVSVQRLHTIANAAPTAALLGREQARAALGIPDDVLAVGWIGRLSSEKQPGAFVELIGGIASNMKVMGVLIGDGPLMPSVRLAAAPLVERGRMRLSGVVPAAGTLLSAFDALVVTSSTEGTPMVALEAMQAGVPVVSTAVGGVPTMLSDGAGVLVPYGDREGMRTELVRVLTDVSFADSIRGRATLRVSERYGRDAWWDRHSTLYDQLMRARKP